MANAQADFARLTLVCLALYGGGGYFLSKLGLGFKVTMATASIVLPLYVGYSVWHPLGGHDPSKAFIWIGLGLAVTSVGALFVKLAIERYTIPRGFGGFLSIVNGPKRGEH